MDAIAGEDQSMMMYMKFIVIANLYVGCNHEKDGDERPVRLWITSVGKISIDAANVIEEACSDLHEDAYDQCDEGSLQKLLDDWCKEQTGTTTYYPCFKRYVEIDWSKYSEE